MASPNGRTQLQTGIEDSPIFDRWSAEPRGSISNAWNAPALAAMLLRECPSLIEIARALMEAREGRRGLCPAFG